MITTLARGIYLIPLAFTALACGGQIEDSNSDDGDALDASMALVVGNACDDDTACPGHTGEEGVFGEGPFCAKTHVGVALPDGYCTAKCTTSADCAGPP